MEENNNQQPQYQQYQQSQYQYQPMPISGSAVASLILGIISILAPVLMILITVNSFLGYSIVLVQVITKLYCIVGVGIISAIIAIVLGAKERKNTNSRLGKAGLICGIIGITGIVIYMVGAFATFTIYYMESWSKIGF